MPIATINATVKGNVYSNERTNWNDCQTATSASLVNQIFLICKCEATSWREVVRGIMTFDTSSIPDNANISSVTFRGFGGNKIPGFGGTLYLKALATASNTTVTSSDYNKANFTTSLGEIAWSSLTSGANNDIAVLASHINKTGYTKIGLIHSNDFNNANPGNNAGNSLMEFTAAQLIINYTVPNGNFIPFL